MKKIGVIGLGKLGLPVAVAMSQKHPVLGFDINKDLMKKRKYEHKELGPDLKDDFQDYFDKADIKFVSLKELCDETEIIFVAVQTPHQAEFEGITRLPEERADFDYTWLKRVAKDLFYLVRREHKVVFISTCLPGTIRKHILPILGKQCTVVYNPYFIAMGSVWHDFLHPEFVLIGAEDYQPAREMADFYAAYHSAPVCPMSIESAELTKVAYNTFISMKIAYANTLMEICHKVPGCYVDDVVTALSKATDRLLSPKYLRGGMGDGGHCHPRDNIAMSWLAKKLDLSHNLFDDIMMCREDQAEWLADLMCEYDLPKRIFGLAFKPETNILTGSTAVLVGNILAERGVDFIGYDPISGPITLSLAPSVVLIGCRHKCFQDYKFPVGSVVIDPHRYIQPQDGVQVIGVGR